MRQKFISRITTDAADLYRHLLKNPSLFPKASVTPPSPSEDRKPTAEEQEEIQREEAETLLMQQEEGLSRESEYLENLGYIVIPSEISSEDFLTVSPISRIDLKGTLPDGFS
jgi:hypothetical protein